MAEKKGGESGREKEAGIAELPPKYKSALRELPKEKQAALIEKYRKMLYEPGEAIGVVAAQSISEPATQTTLRAYHLAGRTQLVTTMGLPRLLELFDARRVPTTPSMEIWLDDEHNTKEEARKIAAEIKSSSLGQIIEEDTIDLLNMRVDVRLDRKGMADLGLDRDSVLNLIRKSIKGLEAKASGSDSIVVEPKKAQSVRDLQSARMKIRQLHVKGLKGIDQAIVEKTEHEGREHWVIRTLGSNLKKILMMPGVDPRRTTTNNIHEISKVLGIEAARNAIVKEVIGTMRQQGVDTDIRHVLLVADAMCRDGEIKAIGRYGVAGEKPSVLSRANFEETIKHLTTAAATGEVDPLEGIIENIIVGNLAPIGTGLVKIKARGRGPAKELPEI